MPVKFNADEVFIIAEKIEKNGSAFYRKAAKRISDANTVEVLKGLADMEDEHLNTFAALRAELSSRDKAQVVFDPQGEVINYLQAMADGFVFDVNANAEDLIGCCDKAKDILKTAIGLEKDSIVFYLGIKDLVPENLGRAKIDNIIREEMGHITILTRELESGKKGCGYCCC